MASPGSVRIFSQGSQQLRWLPTLTLGILIMSYQYIAASKLVARVFNRLEAAATELEQQEIARKWISESIAGPDFDAAIAEMESFDTITLDAALDGIESTMSRRHLKLYGRQASHVCALYGRIREQLCNGVVPRVPPVLG